MNNISVYRVAGGISFVGRWFAWRRDSFNRHRSVSPYCGHLSLGRFLVVQFRYYQFTANIMLEDENVTPTETVSTEVNPAASTDTETIPAPKTPAE